MPCHSLLVLLPAQYILHPASGAPEGHHMSWLERPGRPAGQPRAGEAKQGQWLFCGRGHYSLLSCVIASVHPDSHTVTRASRKPKTGLGGRPGCAACK
jgi:hypothetical protein